MAAMLVASLAVPYAFGTYGVIFGLSSFVVRLLQVLIRRRLAVLAGLTGSGMAVGMHRTSPNGIMHRVSWSVGESG